MSTNRFLTGATTLALIALLIVLLFQIHDGEEKEEFRVAGPTRDAKMVASLQPFTLDEMVDRAGKIFRGTLVDYQPGTTSAGGGMLSTVTYTFRVEHSFKGTFQEKDGVTYAEVTFLGSMKDHPQDGQFRKLSALPDPPKLTVGGDYLLILTPESQIGLSTTVGLGQGSFEIFEADKQEWAKNEFNNAGLFDGPVRYSDLASRIETIGGQN